MQKKLMGKNQNRGHYVELQKGDVIRMDVEVNAETLPFLTKYLTSVEGAVEIPEQNVDQLRVDMFNHLKSVLNGGNWRHINPTNAVILIAVRYLAITLNKPYPEHISEIPNVYFLEYTVNGVEVKLRSNKENLYNMISLFSSEEDAKLALEVIQPLLKYYYGRFTTV